VLYELAEQRLLLHLLPPASPAKTPKLATKNLTLETIDFHGEIGAGEANRTPDPNLGKMFGGTQQLSSPYMRSP
jgi:hypothetical protein